MQEVMTRFKNSNVTTLAVFDIDMVLIQPSDPAFQMANMKRHSTIVKRIISSIPLGKKELFLTLMAINTAAILIDEQTPFYLQELYSKGIPTVALTSNLTGQLADVANLESWKSQVLQKVRIDFSCSAPYSDAIIFDDLPTFRGNYSLFTKGILFANGPACPKGDVLVQFLQVAAQCPQRIVFIDDRKENLQNVEQALQKYDPSIQFEGLHYLGAKDYPSPIIEEKEFEARWIALTNQAMRLE